MKPRSETQNNEVLACAISPIATIFGFILLASIAALGKVPEGDIGGILQDESKLDAFLRIKGSSLSTDEYRRSFCKKIITRNGANGVYLDSSTNIRTLMFCERLMGETNYRDGGGALTDLQSDWCRHTVSGSECLAGSGLDQLGKPKISGWIIKNYPEQRKVKYKAPADFYRVNVRGEYGRYYETKYIVRAFEPGHTGTPGILTLNGKYEASCVDMPSIIRCSIKPPTISYLPGIRPKASEIVQFTKRIVFDCEENTYAIFLDGEKTSGWDYDARVEEGNKYMCQRVSLLLDSDFTGLSDGSPTAADLRWK